ncbi:MULTISPECIES: S41 family peptidase [Nitrospirillum]|uniref:Carboxyl-terminal processing protease n=1 Tax=Nitrospirillum amazonense TaxID=28077 RepID=A0A560FMT9_9PROT|nr:S41 family peptidase [Nitrospirillum amazonense]MEC4591694.1 S41 family peptidase [Nitrospirillum amazonense]TWB22915.1 carboxyl-terminal processing protease [Nitrospirillum amazonense]
MAQATCRAHRARSTHIGPAHIRPAHVRPDRTRRGAALARTVTALAGALALAACAGGPGDRGSVTAEQFYQSAYGKIDELYLEPVDMRRLVMDGLVHAGVVVPDLTVTMQPGGGAVTLAVARRAPRTFALPAGHDAASWAHLAALTTDWTVAQSAEAGPGDQTRETLFRAMLEGGTADLDPYSRYSVPAAARTERSRREGYVGIGVTLEETPRGFRIIAVAPGSPASAAGLLVGDVITAVGGVPIDATGGGGPAMTVEAVMTRLSGPEGTGVPVRVSRTGGMVTVLIGRQRIILPTVTAERAGAVGVLHVSRFNAGTADALAAAIRHLRDADGLGRPTGWVLDLRGNTGGLLDQAVAVADLFITSGPILNTVGRHPDSVQHYDATPDDILDGAPLVVLADGQTASSAEIVLGALVDSGRALDVGTTSFGKGVVQTVAPLPNGGELFITWSRILTPAGRMFDHHGLAPALCTAGLTDAAAILAPLRAQARPAGTPAACPAERNRPAPVDLTVAETLLTSPPLLRRAQLAGQTLLADQPATEGRP